MGVQINPQGRGNSARVRWRSGARSLSTPPTPFPPHCHPGTVIAPTRRMDMSAKTFYQPIDNDLTPHTGHEGMEGMDHSGMAGMEGMDHSGMGMGGG